MGSYKGQKKTILNFELMSKHCPADPRLGYYTFGVHPKDAQTVLKSFIDEPDVERAELVDGNIRIYYKEITNA